MPDDAWRACIEARSPQQRKRAPLSAFPPFGKITGATKGASSRAGTPQHVTLQPFSRTSVTFAVSWS
jgi:hypothetical protein